MTWFSLRSDSDKISSLFRNILDCANALSANRKLNQLDSPKLLGYCGACGHKIHISDFISWGRDSDRKRTSHWLGQTVLIEE